MGEKALKNGMFSRSKRHVCDPKKGRFQRVNLWFIDDKWHSCA